MEVLLVDSNPQDARMLRKALAAIEGVEINLAHAEGPEEALGRLREGRFDLVLLDLSPPDSRGLEAFPRLFQETSAAPVVATTRLEDEGLAAQAIQKGAQDYLVKEEMTDRQMARFIRYAVERGRLRAESRRQAQRAQAGEARLRSLVERTADGIVIVDREGAVRFVNPAGVAMLGRDAEALMGEPFGFPVVAGETVEIDILCDEGLPKTVEMRVVEIEWEGEAAFLASLRDITERKQMEEERNRLIRAVEQAADAIVITDLDGTIIFVNPAFERVSGYSRAEVIGQDPRILKSGRHDEAFYRAMLETLTRGEVWKGHLINRGKDGTLYEVEAVISPVRDAAGKVVNYVGDCRDVTVEREMEGQLRQAQKMEAIGTLAGGIAHDFNNMLTSIIGFVQLAQMEPEGSERWRDCIARIPDWGQRAARLIGQLLTFSRKGAVDRQPLRLLPLVKETLKMLKHTLPEHVVIRLNAPGEAAAVNADPTQMQQVLMNLCVNASHAMPNGGELTVSLENVTLDEAYCRRHVSALPGNYVRLSVRDTGIGMTPEVQTRIFEPFFTIKEPGKGTGLGLSIVYGIVKAHEGHVYAYSEVGMGSEFKVYLPAIKEAGSRQAGPAQDIPAGGTETILLVEDSQEVLESGQKLLERLGYKVLKAKDGVEAMEVYRAHKGEVALVLTDLVMPKMGGEALCKSLRQIDSGVRVLLMSGYSADVNLSDLRKKGLKGFVSKPFDLYSLGRAVRQALDEPA